MSFIDLIAILLIICLCYIGYSKGIKGKTFFLISFTLSSFLMYFIFDKFFIFITGFISNLFIASIMTIGFVLIPIFIIIEFFLRKTLTDKEARTFSASKNKISTFSRIIAAFIGFVGGYIFVFTVISVTVKDPKNSFLFDVPSFVKQSFFYKMASKNSKEQKLEIKTDNINMLSFLVKDSVVKQFSLSKDEVIIILKMIKGISNTSATNLLKMKSNAQIDKIFLKLKEYYEEELSQIDQKYQTNPLEIEVLFSRFKPKQTPTKKQTKEGAETNPESIFVI